MNYTGDTTKLAPIQRQIIQFPEFRIRKPDPCAVFALPDWVQLAGSWPNWATLQIQICF